MKKYYFVFELKRFFHNKKNLALIVITFLLTLYTSLFMVPKTQLIEHIDAPQLQSQIRSFRSFLVETKDHTFQTAGATEYPPLIKINQQLLRDLQAGKYHDYAKNAAKRFELIANDKTPLMPPEYNSEKTNPGYTAIYGNRQAQATLQAFAKYPGPLNRHILDQKTAWQLLRQTLMGMTSLVLLVISTFFAIDIVAGDKKYRTLVKNFPIKKATALWLKTAVVTIGAFENLVFSLMTYVIVVGVRQGFGSLSLPTTAYSGASLSQQPFKIISLGTYLGQYALMLVLTIFFLIRLAILLQVLFKNESIALLGTLMLIFVHRTYYNLAMGFVYPILQFLPTTYFEFGDVVSGYLNYLMTTPSYAFNNAIGPLIGAIIVVEIILVSLSRWRRITLVK